MHKIDRHECLHEPVHDGALGEVLGLFEFGAFLAALFDFVFQSSVICVLHRDHQAIVSLRFVIFYIDKLDDVRVSKFFQQFRFVLDFASLLQLGGFIDCVQIDNFFDMPFSSFVIEHLVGCSESSATNHFLRAAFSMLLRGHSLERLFPIIRVFAFDRAFVCCHSFFNFLHA